MNADGSGQTELTNAGNSVGLNDEFPAWSPNGRKIAFSSNRDIGGNEEIYVMNANGSGQTRITNNTLEDRRPAWSPDGSKITFERNSVLNNSDIHLFVMNSDGSNAVRMTTEDPIREIESAWRR